MGLKEHMKYYSEVYLMLIALCCVFVIGYWDYQDYVDEQSREGIPAEVNTTPLTEYPPTCANNTIIDEFPGVDFTSPETIAKLTLPNYTKPISMYNWTVAPPEDMSEGIEVIYPEHTSKVLYRGNWTAQNVTYGSNWTIKDDNIRGIIIDYHFGGKKWKYITIDGATCHEIPCEFEGAYCLECEELNKSW